MKKYLLIIPILMAIIACDNETIDSGLLQNNNIVVHPIQGQWHLYKNELLDDINYYNRGDQVMNITADSVFTICIPNFHNIYSSTNTGFNTIYSGRCDQKVDYKIFTDNNNVEYFLFDFDRLNQLGPYFLNGRRFEISGDTLTMTLIDQYPAQWSYAINPGVLQWVR
ncbi:MAG: hypothetical protein ACSHWW_07565 [Nonlabens sp.]|uniref:hypothetical protein n=1 Tax=Nonlabens sp. TaxID=1888209 RepID=UPI003EF9F200